MASDEFDVGLSDEEHQALEESVVKAGEVVAVIEELKDAAPEFPPGRAAPPLEEYVAAHVEACRLAMESGLKDHDGQRLARAERYARWRWQGYVDGHVNSL